MRQKFTVPFIFLGILVFLLTVMPAGYTTTYTYDALGRLTTVRYEDGVIIRYTYDPAGNITSRVMAETTQPQDHLLESEHASFRVIRDGKLYAVRLKKGEAAAISVRMTGEDGSGNVSETEVAATARGVDIDTLSQPTSDGTAVFTITGTGSILAIVSFTTEVGTLRLLVHRTAGST